MYRQSEKNLLNSNISTICLHSMVNFDPHPLTAEICLRTWGIPANFNGFRVLASLLHRRRSVEINQTLHDVWPSPGLLHYICILEAVAHNGILPRAKFTLRPSLRSPILAALLHGSRALDVSNALRHGNFRRKGGHPIRHWAVELSSFFGFVFNIFV